MSFRSASRRRSMGGGLPRYDPQTLKPVRDSMISTTDGMHITNLSNYYESYTGSPPQQQQNQQQQLERNNTSTLSRRNSGVESAYPLSKGGDKGGSAFCGGHTAVQLFHRPKSGGSGDGVCRRRDSSEDLLPSIGEGNITIAGSRHLGRLIMSGAYEATSPVAATSDYYNSSGTGYYAGGDTETKRQQMEIYTVLRGGNGAPRRHCVGDFRLAPPPMKCIPSTETKPSRLDNWETRLARNRALASHRAAFLVAQLPAAVLVAIGTWAMFIHRFIVVRDVSSAVTDAMTKMTGHPPDNNTQLLRELMPAELGAGVATIAAGAITILGVALCAARHHRFSHRSVRRQCAWRMCVALMCLLLNAVTGALIVIAIVELRKIDYDRSAHFTSCAPLTCFSPAERVAVGGCALALSVMAATCCAVSAIFGAAALARIRADDADFRRIFRAARISSAHYTNPLVSVTDCY